MHTFTYGMQDEEGSHTFVASSLQKEAITVSFTTRDYLRNLCNVHLTPAEARALAHSLIIYANEADPQSSP